MAPGSMLMIHNAWTIALGNRHDFMDTAALLEKIDGDLAQAYAKRSGGDAKAFAAMMDKETWLTAEETVEAGLANSIAPEKSAKNLAKFDLSAFEAAPAPKAEEILTLKIEIDAAAVEALGAAALAAADQTRSSNRERQLPPACCSTRCLSGQPREEPQGGSSPNRPFGKAQAAASDDAASQGASIMSIQALREQRAAKAKAVNELVNKKDWNAERRPAPLRGRLAEIDGIDAQIAQHHRRQRADG
jgi:hypothetical protein